MNLVHAALARLRGAGDALFALSVLALVLLMVAPLPAALLDVLIATNLAVAATILVVTLFSRDALRFASFPSLLLWFSTEMCQGVQVLSPDPAPACGCTVLSSFRMSSSTPVLKSLVRKGPMMSHSRRKPMLSSSPALSGPTGWPAWLRSSA